MCERVHVEAFALATAPYEAMDPVAWTGRLQGAECTHRNRGKYLRQRGELVVGESEVRETLSERLSQPRHRRRR